MSMQDQKDPNSLTFFPGDRAATSVFTFGDGGGSVGGNATEAYESTGALIAMEPRI